MDKIHVMVNIYKKFFTATFFKINIIELYVSELKDSLLSEGAGGCKFLSLVSITK